MTSNQLHHRFSLTMVALVAALMFSGCASTGDKSSAGASPNKFKADDGRVIDIGKSFPSNGGFGYNNPHLEKGKCWLTNGRQNAQA
jgi:hypothetical protein